MVSIDSNTFIDTPNLRPSVSERVWNSYSDMTTATLQFVDEKPSESRLLMVVMLSNMFFMLSWTIKALITPTDFVVGMMGAGVVLWLLIAIMTRVTAIYATALVLGLVCKALGGTGTMQETRAGVFWGAFVAAPLGLAVAGIATLISVYDTAIPMLQNEHIQMLPYWLGSVPFIWFIAKGASAANRLESAIPLFGILSFSYVVLAVGVKLLATGAL